MIGSLPTAGAVRASYLVLLAAAFVACGGESPAPPTTPKAPAPAADAGAAVADPLGARPTLASPTPFTPPVPITFKRPNGMTVWLLERPSLPIVSLQIVVPAGASRDPEGKGGLAVMTANMLDEGAGKRGPIELASDLDRLGASLGTGATADYASVQLTVLKKNLGAAAEIFGDVVAKPQLSPVEWKRVHDLWENDLKARQSEPSAVASVVLARKGYPASHPYAHPASGTLKSAAQVSLDDVKKFYAANYRPDLATCVIVGDITRAEIDPLLDKALAAFQAGTKALPPTAASAEPKAPESIAKRRVVIVDRKDAPQSVIAVARPGVSAVDEDAPPLVRVNAALGGSFTSRLNQDLREEHGWSYGARSSFSFGRLRGLFVAQAAVHTEHTGEALKAMLADVESVAKDGLTDEEVEKTRLLARADLVEAFETVDAAARRLGRNAGIGLAPDHEATASKVLYRADKAALKRLAAAHVAVDDALVVVVGPRAAIEPQLRTIGFTTFESSTPEGD